MATTNPARRPLKPLEPMDSAPYLAPIEKPKGLMLKLLYWLMGRQFGKVPSWMSVSGARMPLAYLTWAGKVNKLNKKLMLDIGNHGLDIGSDGLCEISNRGKPTAGGRYSAGVSRGRGDTRHGYMAGRG